MLLPAHRHRTMDMAVVVFGGISWIVHVTGSAVFVPETSVPPTTTVTPVTRIWYNGVEFESGARVISEVIETLDVAGVSMCLRRCERYGTHCDRVTYNTDTLQCTLGLSPSSIASASSNFITSTSTVTSLVRWCGTSAHHQQTQNDPCFPNACSGGERCVVTRTGNGICVRPGPVVSEPEVMISEPMYEYAVMMGEPMYMMSDPVYYDVPDTPTE